MTPTIPPEAVEAAMDVLWLHETIDEKTMQAALTAAMPLLTGWRPIPAEVDPAKAPFDGSVLQLGNSFGSWMGKYEPVYQSGYRPDNPWFCLLLNRRHLPSHSSSRPTHWAPLLPPPPAGSEG
jgi:hypothetical protein